jgi:probable HAF family extracellular repeat protein
MKNKASKFDLRLRLVQHALKEAFGGTSSSADGINDAGDIIGQGTTATGGFAFLYIGGQITELNFDPLAINNAGQIVGYGGTGYGASLYSGGTAVDLNTLIDPSSGWKLEKATAISDVGQIVGAGTDSSGGEYAFLLSFLGDFNHDGVVNAADIDLLYANFTAKTGTFNSLYDLNGDGVVGFLDFQILLSYWNPGGWNFAPSEVPEPASLSVILLGGLAVLRRSRK